MQRVLLVLIAVLGACRAPEQRIHVSPGPAGPYDPALDPITGPIWAQAMRTYVAETCDGGDGVGRAGLSTLNSPPPRHVVHVGATNAEQACGLVVYEIFTPEYLATFARDVCNAVDVTISEECSKRFVDMFMARLAERYTAVDWSIADRKCRAYPLECKDSIALERLLLALHNAGVQAWYQEALQAARMNAYRAAQESQLAYQKG